MEKPIANYELYQGDCLNIIKGLRDNCIDAVVTDPPYSSGGFGQAIRGSTQNKYSVTGTKKIYPEFFGDTRDQFSLVLWLGNVLGETHRLLKDGGLCLMFTDWRQLSAMNLAVQVAGFTLRGVVVWDKTGCARPNKGFFSQQAEFVVVASKGKPATWGQEGVYHRGVFSCAPLKGGKHHQTGKPVDVMKWLVNATPKGGTILDPFMGSGSTGVACLETGRRFIGCEMSGEYLAITKNRLDSAKPVKGLA